MSQKVLYSFPTILPQIVFLKNTLGNYELDMTNNCKHTLLCTKAPTPQDYLDLAVILRHLLPNPTEESVMEGLAPQTPYTHLVFRESSDKYLGGSDWSQALKQFTRKPQIMEFAVKPGYCMYAKTICRILVNNQTNGVSLYNLINTTIYQHIA